ncbi:FAD-dependent oxidoreductase [Mongoliitalea daihaiensis]|uniref:FAD-dependent oxidoreductase n=1 Tax=Mongoliitalea daihaiensis TaxID=2782006 RepID=UPI001F384EA7|nr:FAD-dependent oxidoreductase [Mongoliitalea daihaiensis]UJP63256.1 FAD-dependent oxidoreductase [Mongoliitalea daihaiensis]
MVKNVFSTILMLLGSFSLCIGQEQTQLLIIGGGASGVSAAIQASRMGISTVVLEETPWLGGMLTAAGVSAIDGNHRMPSGIWGEFREKLYNHYGGAEAVGTGWVSNTLFEPSIGNKFFQEWTKDQINLRVIHHAKWNSIQFENNSWVVTYSQEGQLKSIIAQMLIDATELGDVMAAQGYEYFIGMDSQARFGEIYAPLEANDIVQDLTYVVILKDFGVGNDRTIPKPEGYDPSIFDCACDHADPTSFDDPTNDCQKMLNYGKLPNGKYMINWPNCGNDFYMNIVEMSPEERMEALKEAKLHSLRFIYYIQQELGYKHLGIADDEFPTVDQLPFIPYHRESRRTLTEAMFTLPHVLEPFKQENPLFRTGIAVGDYTIDHHHKMNLEAPEIDFIKIRVPSYNVPLGSLIPKGSTHLIVAEKSIGVSNIVNGASRLQPVVLGIGQAAGALAAVAILNHKNLQEIEVRDVQQQLLEANAYIMPYIDIQSSHAHFQAIQRIGATGILKGYGVPYKWANQTWFYPEKTLSEYDLAEGLRPLYPVLSNYWNASGETLTMAFFVELMQELNRRMTIEEIRKGWEKRSMGQFPPMEHLLTRLQVAVLLDELLNPFAISIDLQGNLVD